MCDAVDMRELSRMGTTQLRGNLPVFEELSRVYVLVVVVGVKVGVFMIEWMGIKACHSLLPRLTYNVCVLWLGKGISA